MSFHILAAILYPGVLWLPEQLTVQCMSVRDGIYLLSLNTCVYHLTHRSDFRQDQLDSVCISA